MMGFKPGAMRAGLAAATIAVAICPMAFAEEIEARILPSPADWTGLWWNSLRQPPREEAEMSFSVHAEPPRMEQCFPVSIRWTFDGCGAEPAVVSQDWNPTVRFTRAGVCTVRVEITDTQQDPPLPGCGNVWRGQKTVYVLGGPLTINMIRGWPCRHEWDNPDPENPSPPWYLTYFDYNPVAERPVESQEPNKARITAQRAGEQPAGTQYVWMVVPPGVILTPGVVSGQPTNRSSIEIAANGPSQPGQIKVYLEYRLQPPGYDYPFGWWDDTDVVPRPNNRGRASPDYRSFTAHRPTRMELLARGPWVREHGIGPPRWVYRHWWPFYVNDHFGQPMDGIWVQERFPNGVPTQFPDGTPVVFYWNGNPPPPPGVPQPVGRVFWTTGNDVVPNEPLRGQPGFVPCFIDRLEVESPSAYDHPGEAAFGPFVRPLSNPPRELIHTFHAGTTSVLPNGGGCRVGTYRITIWTNRVEHALVSIP